VFVIKQNSVKIWKKLEHSNLIKRINISPTKIESTTINFVIQLYFYGEINCLVSF